MTGFLKKKANNYLSKIEFSRIKSQQLSVQNRHFFFISFFFGQKIVIARSNEKPSETLF